jgi:uncharacterized membrane protein
MRTKAGRVWGRRPVLYAALVRSGIAVLVAFGVEITAEQLAALMLFVVTNSYVETNTPQFVKPRKG